MTMKTATSSWQCKNSWYES